MNEEFLQAAEAYAKKHRRIALGITVEMKHEASRLVGHQRVFVLKVRRADGTLEGPFRP